MAVLRFSLLARQELRELVRYVALDNPEAAQRLYRAVNEQCAALAEMPGLGRPREELGRGIRSFPVAPCLVYYRPVPGGVEVIRVLHAARDVDAAF